MMTDSYNVAPSVIKDAFRFIFAVLDDVFYGLLQIMYQLFFNVASSDIFANDTIMKFYSRVQLILGVFMMFQLAMIIIRGIVNPDSFTDGKTGIGNLIMRICVALFLLTALVPINIPSPQNEYEKQLNNNGLLFGTLYSLQHRILENNTLGRLILGTNDDSDNYVSTANSNSESLKKASRIFASTILKGFYRINLIPEDQRSDKCKKADDPAIYNECRMCQSGIDAYIDAYKKVDAYPSDIINLVNETCDFDANGWSWLPFKYLTGNKRYILTYSPVISTVTAIVFVFIMISFTIDIAVRAIKLAILRLIAPIPIISYMDPKGSKDNAFNSWVKVLSATYLDLFMRLAIVYFVLFLIQSIIVNGLVIAGSGIVKVFSYIAIFIGMFMFAKQAPKFIRQVLGIKEDNFKLFGGMSGIVATAGMIGSAAANYRAAREENAELHPGQNNLFRNVGSALAGAIGGGVAGFGAAGDKDASISKVLQAQNQRNTRRANHSTLPGRIEDNLYGTFTGRSLADRGNNNLKATQDWVKAQGDWKSAVENEAKLNGAATDLGGGVVARYAELERALQNAYDKKDANGNIIGKVINLRGQEYDANRFTQDYMEDALKAQVIDYQVDGHTEAGKKSYTELTQAGQKLYKKREDVIRLGHDVDVTQLESTAVQGHWRAYDANDIQTFGPALGAANNVISDEQNSMKQRLRNANKQSNGK